MELLLKCRRTGSEVRAAFKDVKADSHSGDQVKVELFLRRLLSGAAMVAKPRIKRRKYDDRPRKLRNSFWRCGREKSETAFILSGSGLIPCLLMTWPKILIVFAANVHFLVLSWSLAADKQARTWESRSRCSSKLEERIIMSSK